jgi:hypothetical protein
VVGSDPRNELELLASYDFKDRNEAEIRGDWIDPLLRLLGYGLGTRHRILRESQLRLEPPVRMIGSTRYEVDYLPTVFGHRLWIIEAKKPVQDLFSDEHLGQAWSYATDPRVRVPLMMLCDGTRLGIFDVTIEAWPSPVLDVKKEDLPTAFDRVFEWLGAPRVAERIRLRQLEHLRSALEAQIDLGALDRTVEAVNGMVEEIRPAVAERRREVREEARHRVESKGQAAIDAAGMWGHAQHVNEPMGPSWGGILRAAEIVKRVVPIIRVREFDAIERATTPKGSNGSRMWFSLRALRLGCAVLLSDEDGCAEYCERAAREAAAAHATAFDGNDLLVATYRLQRALGRLGWRMAALNQPKFDDLAAKLADTLDAEEWLRRDGEIGLTAYDQYSRTARLLPTMIQAQINPWTPEVIAGVATGVESQLEQMAKPAGFESRQPIGDPWLDSWKDGDPLRELSTALLKDLPGRTESEHVRTLAGELLGLFSH